MLGVGRDAIGDEREGVGGVFAIEIAEKVLSASVDVFGREAAVGARNGGVDEAIDVAGGEERGSGLVARDEARVFAAGILALEAFKDAQDVRGSVVFSSFSQMIWPLPRALSRRARAVSTLTPRWRASPG